jgi:hypothetical protein
VTNPSLAALRHLARRGPIRAADSHPHEGWNRALAVWVTEHVGTMWCAYVFLGIGAGSLLGLLTGNAVLALACGALSSYVLQLVLLPVIMVGQAVQQAHADGRAEADHAALTHTTELLASMDTKLDDLIHVHGGRATVPPTT